MKFFRIYLSIIENSHLQHKVKGIVFLQHDKDLRLAEDLQEICICVCARTFARIDPLVLLRCVLAKI